MERTAKLSVFLTPDYHDMLCDLAKRSSKTDVLERLIRDYDGHPLEPVESTQSGFKVTKETIERLDSIAKQNGMKSRNRAVILLIEKAHEEWSKTR